MDPHVFLLHCIANRTHRIERSRIHVPNLGTYDCGSGDVRESIRAHAAPLAIGWHPNHLLATETEHSECLEEGRMGLLACHEGDLGNTMEGPVQSTSKPCASSTERRAAASAARFAIVAPVTNAAPLVAGRARSSRTHRNATDSAAAPIGELTSLNAFWSHTAATQFAATAAGSAPPVTKPK